MNFLNGTTLASTFNRWVENAADSRVGFATERFVFSLNKFFKERAGLIPSWAIDRDIIVPKLQEILPQRHMTRMNAAAFLCALSLKHVHSYYDPVKFLRNFLKLYNAKTFDEICEIEEVKTGSVEWFELNAVRNGTQGVIAKGSVVKRNAKKSEQLEAVKIRCWARDLAAATKQEGRFSLASRHKSMTVDDIEELVSLYPSRPVEEDDEPDIVEKLKESDGKETNSAFPKDDYLPMLRKLRADNHMNETQCCIILCFILHSREKRNDKRTSYVTHPMAVANLVRKYGHRYLQNDDLRVWQSTLAALLHDGGEKSNIDLDNDLVGLLPEPVIAAIKCLHKQDGESYFQYLERCASNPLAAVVKLCDIYHNSLDAKGEPSFKQAYVYPIAENYVQYRLKNPKEKLSVAEFAKRNNICSEEVLAEIERIAEHPTDKKKPAGEFRDTLGILNNLGTIRDIFAEEIIIIEEIAPYANTRRKEDITVHP